MPHHQSSGRGLQLPPDPCWWKNRVHRTRLCTVCMQQEVTVWLRWLKGWGYLEKEQIWNSSSFGLLSWHSLVLLAQCVKDLHCWDVAVWGRLIVPGLLRWGLCPIPTCQADFVLLRCQRGIQPLLCGWHWRHLWGEVELPWNELLSNLVQLLREG